jgi:hypothetical protein
MKSRFDELLKHEEEICVKANITNEDFLKTIQRALKLYITDGAIQNRFD